MCTTTCASAVGWDFCSHRVRLACSTRVASSFAVGASSSCTSPPSMGFALGSSAGRWGGALSGS
eukprot:5361591-Prymnesium_polylepis.1